MAYTATGANTGATAAAIVAAAVSGVVYTDAVNNAIATLGWCPVGTQAFVNGTLVKVTTSAGAGSAPLFSYDTGGAVT
jgi:hypothetical protein